MQGHTACCRQGPDLLEGKGPDVVTFCTPHDTAPQLTVCRRCSANTNSFNDLNQYLPTHRGAVLWNVPLGVHPGDGKTGILTWPLKSPGP